jgi:predicted ATPase
MLESLRLKNFTAFAEADFTFASGLNVIVGENGTGKTHVLKVAYSLLHVLQAGGRDYGRTPPTKTHLQTAIADKLNAIFRPDELGRLARRDRSGRQRCEVTCRWAMEAKTLEFSFNTTSKSEVAVDSVPSDWTRTRAVYLPTRELLTIYPGFVSLYETTHLPFEETWRDTCLLLGAPLAKGPREKRIKELLSPLEEAMEGKVELDKAGRFYLNAGGVNTEMHLVAEGLRKVAMIARLVATGTLAGKAFLFWDEPEANLNPKIVKLIARVVLHLCQNGVQVFLASHSLFLMRELDILLQSDRFRSTKARFFGLQRCDEGVQVQQGDSVDDIGTIDALQEELSQSDRYLEAEAH